MIESPPSSPPSEVRLSPAGLAAAVLLLPGPLEHDRLSRALAHEIADLEAAGMVRAGVLEPGVARQLMLMLAPDLHVEAVVVTSAATTITQIWARPDAAIIGRIDPRGQLELAPTEPSSLAWALRSVVGLPASGHAGSVVMSRPPIDPTGLMRFEAALSQGDHAAASALVNGHEGQSTDELAAMAALAAPHRRTWRVTAHWTSAVGPAQRWLSVLDAGEARLWCTSGESALGVSASGDIASLVPTTVDDTWARLRAVLPAGTSDAPSASPDDGQPRSGGAPCPTPAPPSPTASCGSSSPPTTSPPR